MTAPIAADRPAKAAGNARRATNGATAAHPKASADTTTPLSATWADTPTSIDSGGTSTKSESASESPTSKRSAGRSVGSKGHWRQPATVKEFAAQVNAIATAVLNGEVTGETMASVRLYSALVRTVAQAMTTEVQRARFLGEAPQLDRMLEE